MLELKKGIEAPVCGTWGPADIKIEQHSILAEGLCGIKN